MRKKLKKFEKQARKIYLDMLDLDDITRTIIAAANHFDESNPIITPLNILRKKILIMMNKEDILESKILKLRLKIEGKI